MKSTRTVTPDYYFTHTQAISQQKEMMSKMGMQMDIVPVDMNGALIPTEKPALMDISGLPNVEDNIRDRFCLSSGEDADGDDDDAMY